MIEMFQFITSSCSNLSDPWKPESLDSHRNLQSYGHRNASAPHGKVQAWPDKPQRKQQTGDPHGRQKQSEQRDSLWKLSWSWSKAPPPIHDLRTACGAHSEAPPPSSGLQVAPRSVSCGWFPFVPGCSAFALFLALTPLFSLSLSLTVFE